MIVTESEREAETQAEGEAGSMHREPDVKKILIWWGKHLDATFGQNKRWSKVSRQVQEKVPDHRRT